MKFEYTHPVRYARQAPISLPAGNDNDPQADAAAPGRERRRRKRRLRSRRQGGGCKLTFIGNV